MAKWLKLGGLAAARAVHRLDPVTIAVVLSATGASDVLTIAPIAQTKQHTTPAKAVAGLRLRAQAGVLRAHVRRGPLAGTTPRIVTALSRAKAVATFFDVGEHAVAHQDLVELQRSVGQVANHSYTHPHLSQVSDAPPAAGADGDRRRARLPQRLLPPAIRRSSPQTDAAVRRTGLTSVYWTVDTRDVGAPAAAIVKRALGRRARRDHPRCTTASSPPSGRFPASSRACASAGMCPGFLATTQTIGPRRQRDLLPRHGGQAVIAPAFVVPREPQMRRAPATSPPPGVGASTC